MTLWRGAFTCNTTQSLKQTMRATGVKKKLEKSSHSGWSTSRPGA
jgi:hypothetical protein